MTLGFYNIDSSQWRGIPQSYRVIINKTRNHTDHLLDTDLISRTDFQLAQPIFYDLQQQFYQVLFADKVLNDIDNVYSVYMSGVNSAGHGQFSHRCLFRVPCESHSQYSDSPAGGVSVMFTSVCVLVCS